MTYYNIHTHQPSGEPGVVEIVNVIIKDQADEMKECSARYRSFGIHPWYIGNVEEQMEKLKTFVSLPGTVAVGEAGLDKAATTSFDLQQKVFRAQALLAESAEKPLIIHCVKAWQELLAVKKEIKPSMPWIVHGFRGNAELAEQLIARGLYLSFGSRFNSPALRKAWPNRLLPETDETGVGIRTVYQQLADALALPVDALASELAENAATVFFFP
ncbi:MAG: TatD family hydrolase [Tannerellaceae bacterium]|jgi:TatD DNase family protein|nr:TatD family hydrolase [Tannerellaceae bacterium]